MLKIFNDSHVTDLRMILDDLIPEFYFLRDFFEHFGILGGSNVSEIYMGLIHLITGETVCSRMYCSVL